MDLAPYLARIGLPRASLPPTLATLRELVWHHVRHVPFENLDVQLGIPIRLDAESLEDKLVRRRRGGYCFEQNTLFARVLGALGYELVTLAARVRWNATGPTPRTHMLLRVIADGAPWLVDVGFGGFVPTEPLRWVLGEAQPGRLGAFRLVEDGRMLVLQGRAQAERDFADVYAFTEEPHGAVDYELMNHYTSTYPASRFRQNLIVTRPGETERRALFNDEYIVRGEGGVKKERIPVAEIPRLLREVFGLEVPDGTVFPATGPG